MLGCSTELFANLRMSLIEHDSTFYPVERRCRVQTATTLVHCESPGVVVTPKAEAEKKP